MARAVPEKVNAAMLLNFGSTSTGSVKTKSLKIGGTSQNIDIAKYQTNVATARDKIVAIATAVEAILANSVYEIQETVYSQLLAA